MKDRQSARQTVHESSLKSEADLAKSQVSEGPTRVADSRTRSSPPASLMVRRPWLKAETDPRAELSIQADKYFTSFQKS